MLKGEISFKTGDATLIDEIGELWSELNLIHYEKSPHFKHFFGTFEFRDRKQMFLAHAEKGTLFIVFAYDGGRIIGYCVSSIVEGVGEIESLYVKPDYRKSHIGKNLMEKSLEWIKLNGVKKMLLKVAYGNEEVFSFYEKYGFKPRLTELYIT